MRCSRRPLAGACGAVVVRTLPFSLRPLRLLPSSGSIFVSGFRSRFRSYWKWPVGRTMKT